ncbi:MAG: hypothetical protein M3P30_09365 [Chloroflexota bacterium]|nr:hypothetical protein [Chloroflexota bacterium]
MNPAAVESKRVGAGWTLIVGSNGNRKRVGNSVLVRQDADFLFASFLLAAKPYDDSDINPDYFQRWLSSEHVQARLSASAEGTTGLNNLSLSFFRAMAIAVPSTVEQSTMTAVLDAVDAALEHAELARIQARELRRGLLQSFFEFRGSTETTKHSEAGTIPGSWDAVQGRRAFSIVTGSSDSVDALRLPGDEQQPDAWFMKVDDFNAPANRRDIVGTNIGFVLAENRSFKTHASGTVIIAKRGAAILKNRVRVSRVPLALDPNLMALRALPPMSEEFLRYQLEWRKLSRYVEDSGVPQLNNKDLYPRWFLIAPDKRQEVIVKVMQLADAYEDALIRRCDVLESLRESLMHDLITGRVRVANAPAVVS